MATTDAGRALAITQTMITPTAFIDTDPTGLWIGFPYRWQVVLDVVPRINSGATPTFQYDASSIEVGDWISTSSQGVAVKIIEINNLESPERITVTVEDEDLYNLYSDSNFSGSGIGPDGPGLVFPVDTVSKLPVLGPVAPYYLDINAQMDLFARFIQQGKLKSGGALVEVPTDGEIKDGLIKGWVSNQTTVTDALDQLNFLLNKALPARPTDVANLDIVMANREIAPTGVRLAQGPILNNIPGSTYTFGNVITAISSTNAQTEVLTEIGPGDIGALTFSVNGTVDGTILLTTSNDIGFNGGLTILDDYEFPPGSNTWQALNLSMTKVVPDGINQFGLTHTISGSTTKDFVIETLQDTPIISNHSVVVSNPVIKYVSGVPHYTLGTILNYNITADNVVGRTFPSEKLMGLKTFPDIGSSSIDFGNSNLPSVINVNHGPITVDNIECEFTADQTADLIEVAVYANNSFDFKEEPQTDVFLYSAGEQMFLVETPTAQSSQAGIKRVALPDTERPNVTSIIAWETDWDAGSSGDLGDLELWEAPIVGGTAKAYRTNFSTGYRPVGPNFSTKPTTQYISFKIQTITNRLKLEINGVYTKVFIKLPGITNSMPNATNGWWDGTKQSDHAPLYWPGHPTAGDGCLLSNIDGVTEFTFGNISSAAATNNIILVRFVLTGSDEIRSLRIIE